MTQSEDQTSNQPGVSVNVTVNVTKIVKYLSLAGIAVVAIVFASKCLHKIMEEDMFKF